MIYQLSPVPHPHILLKLRFSRWLVSVNVFIKVLSLSLSPPRLLIVKATCVPSASPPCACGNLLLLFKEQRSHRGGLGEVCATDSGAGQVNEPYCLPLQISVRQQPLAFCLLLAPHTHTHTHTSHIHAADTLFTHSPGTPPMVTKGSHSPVEDTDCIWQSLQVALHTLRLQWQLAFQMGVKWTARLDFSPASIIHSLFSTKLRGHLYTNYDCFRFMK